MAKRILIGYVTKTGSTKATAEEIGELLSAKGFAVETRPLSEAGELGAYDAFIIGAPVNGMAWHPSALEFVKANQAILASKPTAYFLLSIAYGVGRESLKLSVPARLAPASAIVAPMATACFGGVMATDPPLVLRLAFWIKKGAPRDSRDHAEIRAFADTMAGKLG